MLSSGLRKVVTALLILPAAAWIKTDANATSRSRLLASIPNVLSSGANRLLGERLAHIG